MSLSTEQAAQVLGQRLDVRAALDEIHTAARATVDADLLAACERRIAELLQAPLPAAGVECTHPGVEACLAFTEHWVIDIASMPDELVAGVTEHFGDDGTIDFVQALLVIEQRLRLAITWDRLGLIAAS